ARKFTNKLWNMGRFIEFAHQTLKEGKEPTVVSKTDEWNKFWSDKIKKLAKEITGHLDTFNFNYAAEKIYDFVWHEFADKYIEDIKPRMTSDSLEVLEDNFKVVLKLLHPFMPFVTEEIYQRMGASKSIMIEKWPSFAKATER
ncbi:MAG: class I tRNA ligase family protein, partial [bacterium]|nr:class I tRNA ligase family protein [bacterium]